MAEAKKREQVAKRHWIDSKGTIVDEDQATGFQYDHLKSGKSFQYIFAGAKPGTDITMLAIFGGLTLAGNYASQVAGTGDDRDTSVDPTPTIREKFEYIRDGEWPEREGGVGPRYDREKLSQAIATVVGKGAKPETYIAKMDTKVDPKTGAVSADKGAISYGAWALRNTQVKVAYDKLAPVANAPTVDKL